MPKGKSYTFKQTKHKDPFPKDMQDALDNLDSGNQSSFLRKLMILGWEFCKENGIDAAKVEVSKNNIGEMAKEVYAIIKREEYH